MSVPALIVELDDGTGSWPYDVTSFVYLTEGWSVSRGRADEMGEIDASTLQLTLNNSLGHFTLGSPVFGIYVDQPIRVMEQVAGSLVTRFTGFVQDWPTSWQSPTGGLSLMRVEATDRLARLSRRVLRSMLEQEVLSDGPVAYYTLGEPSGSLYAGDTSGHHRAVLGMAGAGDPVVFGNATGPSDGLTAAEFAAGMYLLGGSLDTVFSDYVVTVECWFSATTPGTLTGLFSQGVVRVQVEINASGHLSCSSLLSAASVTDGLVHHAVYTSKQESGLQIETLYLDGIEIDASAYPALGSFPSFWVQVGGDNSETTLTGAVSHVAVYDTALTPTRILSHYTAGRNVTEPSDVRIRRLAEYANIATTDQVLEPGRRTVTPQATTGQSVTQAMQTVADAEGGIFFIDTAGRLVFQNRDHRPNAVLNVDSILLAGPQIQSDLVFSADKQYLLNTLTGSRDGGATQTVEDPASVSVHEQYPASVTLILPNDQDILDVITWQLYAYKDVEARIKSVTVDMLTQTGDNLIQHLLAAELGDHITLTGLPSQAPAATVDMIIEGIEETQSLNDWMITFNTVPATKYMDLLILNDPVRGLLDSGRRLYY